MSGYAGKSFGWFITEVVELKMERSTNAEAAERADSARASAYVNPRKCVRPIAVGDGAAAGMPSSTSTIGSFGSGLKLLKPLGVAADGDNGLTPGVSGKLCVPAVAAYSIHFGTRGGAPGSGRGGRFIFGDWRRAGEPAARVRATCWPMASPTLRRSSSVLNAFVRLGEEAPLVLVLVVEVS